MSNPVKFASVIVCDDIRREDNGKALLIGAYAGDILVPQFPAAVQLSFYVTGIAKNAAASIAEFRIQHTLQNGETPMVSAKANIAGAEIGRASVVVLPRVPFNFDEATDLTTSVLDGAEWRVLDRKRVRLASEPAA
jgi:hypothetical protein